LPLPVGITARTSSAEQMVECFGLTGPERLDAERLLADAE